MARSTAAHCVSAAAAASPPVILPAILRRCVAGYEGLLLHRLAPDLAVRAYPWLTHPKLELVINIITQVGSLVPTVALITAYVPKWTLLLAILLYIPVRHSLAI